MVHPIFQFFLQNRETVDKILNFMGLNPKFSSVFHTLFPPSGQYNSEIASFLDVITQRFTLDQDVGSRFREQTTKLFQQAGINDLNKEENRHAFSFCLYLFEMYWSYIFHESDTHKDNIFAFMTHHDISSIRVVIIGKEPVPGSLSSGLAFHSSVSPLTHELFDLVNSDLSLVDEYTGSNKILQVSKGDMATLKTHCNLSGWIEQGVLLINYSLTHGLSGWSTITKLIISYLAEINKNMVFIVAGGGAKRIRKLVDESKHLVVVAGDSNSALNKREMSGRREIPVESGNLPFLNANFYLYQCINDQVNGTGGVSRWKDFIDWSSFSEIRPGGQERKTILWALCKYVLKTAGKSDVLNENGHLPFYLRKLQNGKFLLEHNNSGKFQNSEKLQEQIRNYMAINDSSQTQETEDRATRDKLVDENRTLRETLSNLKKQQLESDINWKNQNAEMEDKVRLLTKELEKLKVEKKTLEEKLNAIRSMV